MYKQVATSQLPFLPSLSELTQDTRNSRHIREQRSWGTDSSLFIPLCPQVQLAICHPTKALSRAQPWVPQFGSCLEIDYSSITMRSRFHVVTPKSTSNVP